MFCASQNSMETNDLKNLDTYLRKYYAVFTLFQQCQFLWWLVLEIALSSWALVITSDLCLFLIKKKQNNFLALCAGGKSSTPYKPLEISIFPLCFCWFYCLLFAYKHIILHRCVRKYIISIWTVCQCIVYRVISVIYHTIGLIFNKQHIIMVLYQSFVKKIPSKK